MPSGIDGFLGTRASLVLDFVAVAMIVVLPVLGFSLWLVKYRRAYHWHKRLQISLGVVLALAIGLFEWDMRRNGWRDRAMASPYYGTQESPGAVFWVLGVHLCVAVSTALLWVMVIVRAIRNFPSPPKPNQHSAAHIFWARLAAFGLTGTALTGWVFYWVAFVAT